VYRWCCYVTLRYSTKHIFDEVDLKYGDGDISEGSSVLRRSKGDVVGGEPLPSKSTNQIPVEL